MAHLLQRQQQRKQCAQARTLALLARMKAEAKLGQVHLATAKLQNGLTQISSPPLHAPPASAAVEQAADACPAENGQQGAYAGSAAVTGSVHSDLAADCVDAVHIGVAFGGSTAGLSALSSCDIKVLASADKATGDQNAGADTELLAPATPSAAAQAARGQAHNQNKLHSCGLTGDLFSMYESGRQDTAGKSYELQHSNHASKVSPSSLAGSTTVSGAASSSRSSPGADVAAPGADAPVKDMSAELAFRCFVRAVHALQSLDLQGGVVPHVVVDGVDVLVATTHSSNSTSASVASAGGFVKNTAGSMVTDEQRLEVPEDEQAELYCCWAESVLLKLSICSCPGCSSLAVQAIRMAHVAVARLFRGMQKTPQLSRLRSVGVSLGRVVHAHIALLCQTEAHSSPSRASVWRAQQCLQEWDALAAAEMVELRDGSGDAAQAHQANLASIPSYHAAVASFISTLPVVFFVSNVL
jgi:hypothetical protein